MKNSKKEIDKLIKSSLTKEEIAFYENLNEQSLIEMVGGLFAGKLKWINIFSNIIALIFMGIAIYCLIQFLKIENTNDIIRWGTGMIACLMTISMIKIWNWNQMDKNTILREIKRVEFQIGILSKKLSKTK